MKIKITGKDFKSLEDSLLALVKIRQMGRSLGDSKYIELASSARDSINMILGKLERDAKDAGVSGDLGRLLNAHPIHFNV